MSDGQTKHPVGTPGDLVVESGRRLAVCASMWIDDWYVSHSPRNDNQNAEGPWHEWVDLAHGILNLESRRLSAIEEMKAKEASIQQYFAHGVRFAQALLRNSFTPDEVRGFSEDAFNTFGADDAKLLRSEHCQRGAEQEIREWEARDVPVK